MSWPMVKLGDVSEPIMGQAPPGTECNKSGQGTIFVKAGEFGVKFPEVKEWTTKPLKFAKTGDTLLCVVGATCGKVNRAINCSIGRSVAAIRPNTEVLDSSYLYYFISSWSEKLRLMSQGAAQTVINKDMINSLEIPLPPLEEQKRIAAILDKSDAIRQKRKQAIALSDEFLRSVFLEMFGDPLANPKNHTVRNLGELCNLITDGKHGDCEDEENSGYFFVSAKNVRNSELCLDGSRQINKKEFLEVHKRTCLEPGALLLVNTGATIGKVAILPQSEIVSRCTLQKSVAVIKPKKEILNNEFLMKIIQLRVNDFASKGSGSAIKNLLLSQIREFPIISPSIESQEKYAAIAKNVKENTDYLKESGLVLNDFFNALSQKAFSGQL
ncbi:hypothetical protein FCV66_13525 [Enterovibrio norvegicus]|uniref:restriction endonuclease subunit S n=1 Tax=Enterovibrio norvegicus TaxID=188144 RepID=UPI0010BF4573|nr:restriction endonuclease subunit S [Enterovibrio norvegicus]TKF13387.1 hypothetical protein FCV66_13525 [Enterovibrio norvegicus]